MSERGHLSVDDKYVCRYRYATQSQSVIIDIDQSAIQRTSHPQIRFLSAFPPPPKAFTNTVVHPATTDTIDIDQRSLQ